MRSEDLGNYLLALLLLAVGVCVYAVIESKRMPAILQPAMQQLSLPLLALGLLNAIAGLRDYFLDLATVDGALHTAAGILYAVIGWKLWNEGKPPRRRRRLRQNLRRLLTQRSPTTIPAS